MSLFQKSVEKKYLNDLDSTLIDKQYADFQNYFGNSEIQENIRNSKEEQFQEGFLRELFVSILGYTLNPHPNFNLTTELKNITNSKKADGAILKGEDATAVIELKGTDTTDLDKIETQAFGYKNHHPKCKYVITSNFEKLRFYIQNAVDHVDFDLFNLSKEQFSLLWLCLAKDNLLSDLPLKIKESSVLQEENITKKLYADYSKFREAIFNNLVKNNPETDKLLLFKKTQKLLDRFLFIFFAEDRLLVPPNSISQIIEKWKDDSDFGDAKPLYYTFKKYFHVINSNRKEELKYVLNLTRYKLRILNTHPRLEELKKENIDLVETIPDNNVSYDSSSISRYNQGVLSNKDYDFILKQKLKSFEVAGFSNGYYIVFSDLDTYKLFDKKDIQNNIKQILYNAILGKVKSINSFCSLYYFLGNLPKIVSDYKIEIDYQELFDSFSSFLDLSMLKIKNNNLN